MDGFWGVFVFYGLDHLFWHGPPEELAGDLSAEQVAEKDAEEKRRHRQYAVSAGVFLLTVVSKILETVFGIE